MNYKKIAVLLSVVLCVFFLTSCNGKLSEKNITMQMVEDANTTQKLLEENNSFSVTCTNGENTLKYFVTDDVRYEFDGENHNVINDAGHFRQYESGEYSTVLYAGVDPLNKSEDILVLKGVTSKEEIVETSSEKNTIYLKTRLLGKDFEDYCKIQKLDELKGGYLEVEYTLDNKTLEIDTMVENICRGDGTVINSSTYTLDFNQVMPVEVNDIIWHMKERYVPEYDMEDSETEEETENASETETELLLKEDNTDEEKKDEEKEDEVEKKRVRLIKVILDPKTDDEREYSVEILSDNTVTIVKPDEYEKLYKDENLTVEFDKDDESGDLTLYSKKSE